MSVANGTPGDKALAFNEIQKALSDIASNLGKLVPVERQHVAPPAVAAFVYLFFLMLIRRPVEDFISAVFFTVLLTSFAWPVWTALKLMYHRLDEINVKMDVLQNSIECIELAVSRRPTIDYVPDGYPVFPDPVEGPPETSERNAQPIESSRQAPRSIEEDEPFVNVERPESEPSIILVTPEGVDEPLGPTDPIPTSPEHTVCEIAAENPDQIQAAEPGVLPVITDKQDPIPPVEPSGNDGQNVDISTGSISPAPSGSAGRVEEEPCPPAVDPSRASFVQWSSTLSEIKQKIEPLASATLQRVPLEQREPVVLVSLRRIALRLLMYCASLSTADCASPNGFLGPPDSVSYYPTGDLEGDRSVAFTTALDCIDELIILLPKSGKSEIAGALSELAQAFSDLGLHEYASSVSGFALEIFRDLYAAEPDRFRSRLVSVQSLRANILVDLKQNNDAADAAEEAVTILKDNGNAQTELVYAMLNYAVLLGSIGRGEGAAAVAFELMGFFEDPTNIQPDLVLVSSLCELCISNACIEFDIEMALSEAEKAIEASRATSDGNSKVVLAGALLTKSKILSSQGQTNDSYAISAEAVTLFRSVSVDRHAYSLLLAHALDTHSRQLSEVNRRVESYPIISEAVELWQALQITAPVATKRPLAWALFELAKYRFPNSDKQKLRNELQIAESAVSTFRDVEPLDYAGLADALYLYADRMLELDKNREAATYAEESVQYFREANEKTPQKHVLDLIFALSLASSCLACTERGESALEYAKEAVALQHGREGEGETQHYANHLRKLLFDVIHRGTEMDRQEDVLPWMRELEQLGEPENVPLTRRGGKPPPKNDTEFRKETSYWMDGGNSAPKLGNGSTSSAGTRAPTPNPTPAPQLDKGKGREVTPSPGPSVDKGKARAITPENPFSPSSDARRLSGADEEILSPAAAAAAAQRRRDALAGMGSPRGGSYGSGNNNDFLSGLMGGGMGGMGGGMGGRTLGGSSGPTRSGVDDRLSGLLGGMGMGGMGGRPITPSSPPPMGPNGRPLGSPIPQTARAPSPPGGRAGGGRMNGMNGLESLLGGLGGLGPGGGRGGLGGMGGGGFDPGMFGPELFRGSNKDKADGDNKGTSGTGTQGGDDTTPRSGTWSGTGIQRNFE
jgi:tetratricopeptide (TPR) repeat protein